MSERIGTTRLLASHNQNRADSPASISGLHQALVLPIGERGQSRDHREEAAQRKAALQFQNQRCEFDEIMPPTAVFQSDAEIGLVGLHAMLTDLGIADQFDRALYKKLTDILGPEGGC